MKEHIRHILREETSRQTKLIHMITNLGLTNTAKAVGGYNRLVKALEGTDYFRTQIDITPIDIRYYLSGSRGQGKGDLFYRIIMDPYDFWDGWEDYDTYQLMDELNEENLKNVRKILSEEEGEDLSDIPLNELLWYDQSDRIGNALRSAANIVDGDAYGDHLYKRIIDALEQYGGKVLELNDENISFTVDMETYISELNDETIDYIIERCGLDLSCLFDELKSDGWIDKPKPRFNESWYNSNFDIEEFNQLFSEHIDEYL